MSAPLFDEFDRPDLGPRLYAEDTFTFLNRATGIVWERIRDELGRWYANYPDDSDDLRRRFRSRDYRQHYGAWWELYLHKLLTSLGFGVTPHPEVPGSSGRPDFLVERGQDAFYVEAVTEFSGIAANPPRSALEPAILDVITESTPQTSSSAFASRRPELRCHGRHRSLRQSQRGSASSTRMS